MFWSTIFRTSKRVTSTAGVVAWANKLCVADIWIQTTQTIHNVDKVDKDKVDKDKVDKDKDKVDRDNVDKDKDGQGQGGVSSSISRTFLELRSSFHYENCIAGLDFRLNLRKQIFSWNWKNQFQICSFLFLCLGAFVPIGQNISLINF